VKIIPRSFVPPKGSFFLFGPRGTRKSFWVRQNFPQALYVDLLDPELFRLYSAYPERLKEVIAGNPDKKVVVLILPFGCRGFSGVATEGSS
jgi:hypothetical protein